jgi:hypothetical protein
MAILFPLRGLWLEKHVGLTIANTRYYSLIPIMSDTKIYRKFAFCSATMMDRIANGLEDMKTIGQGHRINSRERG